MKPLHYTFNGEEHEMSAAEARSIEMMGTAEISQSGPRITLQEACAIMRLRPGATNPVDADILRYSKSDEHNYRWHINRGGCNAKSERAIHYPAFRSKYTNAPSGCCINCVKALRNRGDKNFGEAGDASFVALRAKHNENAAARRKSDADKLAQRVRRARAQTLPGEYTAAI